MEIGTGVDDTLHHGRCTPSGGEMEWRGAVLHEQNISAESSLTDDAQ